MLGKHFRELPEPSTKPERYLAFHDTASDDGSDSGLEDLWHGDNPLSDGS